MIEWGIMCSKESYEEIGRGEAETRLQSRLHATWHVYWCHNRNRYTQPRRDCAIAIRARDQRARRRGLCIMAMRVDRDSVLIEYPHGVIQVVP